MASIVGRWERTGGKYWEFYSDGTFSTNEVPTHSKGDYRAESGMLGMFSGPTHADGTRDGLILRYAVSGITLELTSIKGVATYRRADLLRQRAQMAQNSTLDEALKYFNPQKVAKDLYDKLRLHNSGYFPLREVELVLYDNVNHPAIPQGILNKLTAEQVHEVADTLCAMIQEILKSGNIAVSVTKKRGRSSTCTWKNQCNAVIKANYVPRR